jgi:DNA-binding MarR family transcriptional regulator
MRFSMISVQITLRTDPVNAPPPPWSSAARSRSAHAWHLLATGYAELRPMHGFVLQALRGDGMTSSELAERLGVTKQAAGQIVDDLVARGYLERRPHPAGGRRKLDVLTWRAERHPAVAGRELHALETQLAARLAEAGLLMPRDPPTTPEPRRLSKNPEKRETPVTRGLSQCARGGS